MIDVPEPERAIVISNGRCGSTLLSNLIADEPDTLSLHEFFMSAASGVLTEEVVTGSEYWRRLSRPKPEFAELCRIGRVPKEVRYPSDGRFAGDYATLPPIMAITLPKISDDPDALYDKLSEIVPDFPEQSFARHHELLLDLLASMNGKKRWVERSGGSSHLAPYLLANYPTAKIVYLTRNWPESAKSMSKHSSFQLIQLRMEFVSRAGFDPFRQDHGAGQVPEDMVDLLPGRLTADALISRGEDLQRYMMMCAFLTSQAEQALVDRPPAQLYTIRYEDLLEDPAGKLTELAEFLGFGDPAGWADRVAGQVDPTAPLSASA